MFTFHVRLSIVLIRAYMQSWDRKLKVSERENFQFFYQFFGSTTCCEQHNFLSIAYILKQYKLMVIHIGVVLCVLCV